MAKITTKETHLESVLREMVRDVITEELSEMMGDLAGYDSWKTRTPDDPSMPYNEPEDMDEPHDAMAAHMEPGPMDDPELEMDPANRERMIDALLGMEFQESATKSIPVATLREMIRESVRRHMKSKK